MARPTKLDKNIERKILDVLKMGNYIETAAAFGGIDPSTFYRWLKRGKLHIQKTIQNPQYQIPEYEKRYVRFKRNVDQALAEAEIRELQIIMMAANEDWRAAAWILERRYPDKWGKKNRHEITGQGGGALEIKSYKESLQKKIEAMIED